MRAIAITLTVGVALIAQLSAQKPPAFKVAVHSRDSVVLLVPASATDSDLANLLNALRAARKGGTLGAFFPPTTPGGSRGPYGAVQVFVMSDAAWATAPHLKAFMNPHDQPAAEREFGKRVRAEFLYPIAGPDFGSIGYEDQDIQYKTQNYKKVF